MFSCIPIQNKIILILTNPERIIKKNRVNMVLSIQRNGSALIKGSVIKIKQKWMETKNKEIQNEMGIDEEDITGSKQSKFK